MTAADFSQPAPRHRAQCAAVQSSENQLQEEEEEEEEEGFERLRDVERKLGGEYGRNSGDWFVGFVQAPEAGEPFGRERIITWRNRLRNRFTSAATPKISQRCDI